MRNKTIAGLSMCWPLLFLPSNAFADVVGSLRSVQGELVGRILPVVAVLGFIYAGFSFITGNANARSHLTMAMIGAAIAFGATSILNLIQSVIN